MPTGSEVRHDLANAADYVDFGGLAGSVMRMGDGVQNTYQATAYRPDAGAYTIDNQYAGDLQRALTGASGRATPMATSATSSPFDARTQAEFRGHQLGLVGALQRRASGQAPSVAELQLRRGMDDAIAAQMATAASARGISPGLAQRLAADGIAQVQSRTNMDAALLRAGEQARAEEALGGVLSGARGQDIGVAEAGQRTDLANAGFLQSSILANQQAELANREQMDRATQAYIAMGMSREEAQQRALADMQALKAQQSLGVQQINSGVAQQNQQSQQQAQAGLIGAAGSVVGGLLSDERAKKNVEDADEDVDHFMAALSPKSWDYTEEAGGEKEHFGFMAQDAERSRIGKAMVKESGGFKRVDRDRGLMAALASVSRLHKRLEAIEGAA